MKIQIETKELFELDLASSRGITFIEHANIENIMSQLNVNNEIPFMDYFRKKLQIIKEIKIVE